MRRRSASRGGRAAGAPTAGASTSVSPTSAGRFAERARRRRRLALRPLLAAAIVLALAGGAAWAVFWSSLLDVRTVAVTGEGRLQEPRVLEVAAVPDGRPMARVDTGAIAARVAALPPVADAKVHRRWPHTVEVVLSERQPVAAVPVPTGFRLLDPAGVAFATVESRPRNLPLLRVTLSPDDADLRVAAARVIEALPPAVASQVVEVRARTPDDVQLRLRDERIVRWGSPERSLRKGVVLQALMSRPAGEEQDPVEVYDVSAPGVPTTS